MSPIVKEQDVLTATPETTTTSSLRPTAGAEVAAKPQPVALEIAVTVNGARTIEGSDKREPFSESTKTVLVLGTGAVIRLSSAVAPGQLLFLTNDKTKKEVVCQVVKSKNFRNVSGYVELEFTESAVGFWGMRFPADRIGGPAVGGTPVAVAAPVLASVPPLSAAPKKLDTKPATVPSAVSPAGSISTENKVPVVVSRPAAPISAPVASTTVASNSLTATDSFSSTALPSASPNSSVLSLPRALEVKPAVAQKPAVPVILAPVPQTEANPMRRASDIKKAEPAPSSAAKSPAIEAELAPHSIPESAAKIFEFTEPDPTPVKRGIPAPTSFATTSTLDLEAEETKIPAWLEPLARNAAAPVSTQELIEREKARHAAAITEIVEPEPLAEAIATEAMEVKTEVEVLTPAFGAGFLTDDASISENAGSGGSRKGIVIGLLAAGVAIAAGGWWYTQQAPRGTQAGAATVSASSAPNAPAPSAQNNLQPAPVSAAGLSTVPVSAASSGLAASKPNASPASTPPSQNASLAVNPSETASRTSPAAAALPKKPSLGEVRLATPKVNAGGTRNVSAESAPSLTSDEIAAESLGAGGGLAGNSHKQPVAPAPALPTGGEVKAAKLLSSISPVYPGLAKNQRISGDVRVDALVDVTGRVTAVKVISGPALLQQAAIDAIRGWKYEPATLDGKSVPMHLTVTLQFRLQQ
ncbi:MAG TPA: TonB family protein [Candidatus Saccharimonadales bacterium]|nr:TonB family protein [Candidatus Saccharimonadales bacterium]